jgi:uncharacterized membrane protein YidH (DUF202 family)
MLSPAKLVLLTGIIVVIGGLIMMGSEKMNWLGKLPGDLHFQRRNVQYHIPITTSIILSIILTIVLNLLLRRR